MKKRTLKQEFIYLASGESISVVLFCIVYVLYTKPETRFATSSAVLYFPLLILNLILLQGSIYWLNCLKRIQKKKALETQLLAPLYKGLKMLDFIMLLAYIPIWIWSFRVSSSSNIIIGVLLWLFAIIEFVNYFYYRLSYYAMGGLGLQVMRPLKLLLTGKAAKSQIAKEISLYEKNMEHK